MQAVSVYTQIRQYTSPSNQQLWPYVDAHLNCFAVILAVAFRMMAYRTCKPWVLACLSFRCNPVSVDRAPDAVTASKAGSISSLSRAVNGGLCVSNPVLISSFAAAAATAAVEDDSPDMTRLAMRYMKSSSMPSRPRVWRFVTTFETTYV